MDKSWAASSRLTSSFASGGMVARAGGFLFAVLTACIVCSFDEEIVLLTIPIHI
jgi:hypothetical protein